MSHVQCWPLYIFLNNILVLGALDAALHDTVNLPLCLRIRMLHRGIDSLLDLDIFVKPLSIPLVCSV